MKMGIVYFVNGWYVVNDETRDVLSGPFDTHAEAEQSVATMAFRIAQGWAP